MKFLRRIFPCPVTDIIGAKKNGIINIGVSYGYGSHKELEAADADYIVDSTKELAEILYSI